MKRIITCLAVAAVAGGLLAGCSSDAQVVNDNITKDADNFKILRRVVFYNGITDKYVLVIEGYCSVQTGDPMTVTCKIGDGYKRHYLKQSDNVTWFAEQIDAANVSAKHYKVIFKPESVLPVGEIR